jgi:serine/threonine protein kinase
MNLNDLPDMEFFTAFEPRNDKARQNQKQHPRRLKGGGGGSGGGVVARDDTSRRQYPTLDSDGIIIVDKFGGRSTGEEENTGRRNHTMTRPHNNNKKPDKEELPVGCELVEWQRRGKSTTSATTTITTATDQTKTKDVGGGEETPVSTIMNCNVLHELDLRGILGPTFNRRRRNGNNHPSGRLETNKEGMTTASETNHTVSSARYLSSGLWRDVWTVPDEGPPTAVSNEGVVLKMMKPEHDLTTRNYDRHRREALVMEHLTSSPFIMNLYAYCGNTIVTEYASLGPVQDLVVSPDGGYQKDGRVFKKRPQIHAPPPPGVLPRPLPGQEIGTLKETQVDDGRNQEEVDSDIDGDDSDFGPKHQLSGGRLRRRLNETVFSPEVKSSSDSISAPTSMYRNELLSQRHRLELMLQASRAISTLHENDIIHADLTGKQLLLVADATTNHPNGNSDTMSSSKFHLKLNDFNRCRFVPHRISKKESSADREDALSTKNVTSSVLNTSDGRCTIRIPSAPGLYRSPEEYADKALTTQIDIFSLGHVLVEIWFGVSPWDDTGGRRVRDMVQDGVLPPMLQSVLRSDSAQRQSKHVVEHASPIVTGRLDHTVADLISKCYIVNPSLRITAAELVRELQELLAMANNSTELWV